MTLRRPNQPECQRDQRNDRHHHHGDHHVATEPHRLTRRNEVAVIAGRDATVMQLAPRTIAYLQVPLTPARAARLADFCARTGVDPQSLVIDLIEDVIFNEAPTVS